MTLEWPLALVICAALGASVVGLRIVLPYVVGQSSERARIAALESINKRLDAVEGHLATGVRRMPGRL